MLLHKKYYPCCQLSLYVKSYMLFESSCTQSFNILPATGLMLAFQYKGKLPVETAGNSHPAMRSGLFGLQERMQQLTPEAGTGKMIVNFTETGAAAFFHLPLNELFGRNVSLDNFVGKRKVDELEEMLYEYRDDHDRKVGAIEGFLLAHLKPRVQDAMVTQAITRIQQAEGKVRVIDLCKELKTSQSSLEKRFRHIVGTSPKQYAMITRMKLVVGALRKSELLTPRAYDAGYYDQAHFINNFKKFTGVSPRKYMAEPNRFIKL